MTHIVRVVAIVAVLVALGVGPPVNAQTQEIDALHARAEQGDAAAQYNLGACTAPATASGRTMPKP